jgi:hypothetical protein
MRTNQNRSRTSTRGWAKNANHCKNDDTNRTSSTRPVFPLSTMYMAYTANFQSGKTSYSFPVLASKCPCGKGDGEGATPEDLRRHPNADKPKNHSKNTNNDNNTGTDTATCVANKTVLSDYAEIDEVVFKLYEIFTRDPGVMVQIQIDRYLFAASSKFVQECGGDMHMCVLHESQVPSIFNLPDLMYILRQRLVRGSWLNSLQETVCRYTIPGMQKSRWVTRQRKTNVPQGRDTGGRGAASSTLNLNKAKNVAKPAEDTLDDTDASLSSVYINTMFGLLLGLYPRCSKRPGFTMRVRIVRAVRALLASSVKVQTDFIMKHVSLVRLSMVEYFANVLDLYCPVEYQLLQHHVDVDAYVNLCRSSCDLFRVNNLSEGVQQQQHNEPLNWGMLDQLAYKMTDKIIRSTRVDTKLVNYVGVHHKSIKKLVSSDIYKHRESCDQFLSLVKSCAVACWHDDHSYLYERMLTEANSSIASNLVTTALDLNLVVSDVHSVVRICMLPANFIRAQIETLRKLYEHDPVQLRVLCKKRICLQCLLRIAPKQFVLEEKINGNIRMHLDTDTIFCNRCMSDAHIIDIDLIGRLLRINHQYLYLCIECGAMHEWKADGCDLLRCQNRPKQRLQLRCKLNEDTVHDNEHPRSLTGNKCRTHCFMCSKLCTGHGLWLLHVGSMRMIHFNLCSTHLPPLHMLQYIVDTMDYQKWMNNTSTVGTGHGRKKRRW